MKSHSPYASVFVLGYDVIFYLSVVVGEVTLATQK